MNRPRFGILVIITAVLLVTLACNFSASTAKITDAYLAFDQQGTQKTSIYAPTDQFYAIVSLSNAPDDTTVKAVWTGVDLVNGEKNVSLVENEITSGDGKIYFNASGDWSVGKYKVDIYLNGKLDRTLEFEVGTPPASAASELVSNAYLAKDEAGQQATSVFGTTDIIYAIVEMPEAPSDTRVRAEGNVVKPPGVESNSMIDQAETTGTGTFTFNLTPTNPWPIGDYRVDIYVNDEIALTMNYQVQ